MKHWGGVKGEQLLQVMWKDLLTRSWKGPNALISSGRGYACVFPQDAEGPIWIPDRLIRPFHQKKPPWRPQKRRKKQQEKEVLRKMKTAHFVNDLNKNVSLALTSEATSYR